jgi:FixJ family two-component response regulator
MNLPSMSAYSSGRSRAVRHFGTVFIVDDDVSMRESLEFLVRCAGWQTATFESAEEFLAQPRTHVPSCMVLDVKLPKLSGFDLQSCLAVDGADIPIIFIAGYCDVPMAVKAMKAGAFEFLGKPFSDDMLLSAIEHGIERSRIALDREVEMQFLRELYAALSRREQEVMVRVVCGRPNKQIGLELGICEVTVKAHRGRMMKKMNAASLPELVKMACKLRLADGDTKV